MYYDSALTINKLLIRFRRFDRIYSHPFSSHSSQKNGVISEREYFNLSRNAKVFLDSSFIAQATKKVVRTCLTSGKQIMFPLLAIPRLLCACVFNFIVSRCFKCINKVWSQLPWNIFHLTFSYLKNAIPPFINTIYLQFHRSRQKLMTLNKKPFFIFMYCITLLMCICLCVQIHTQILLKW